MAATEDRYVRTQSDHLAMTLRIAADQDILYMGAFAGSNSGNARALTAGDLFLGLITQQVDNSGGSAGDKKVEVKSGMVIEHAVTGLDGRDHIGDLVYASADDTLTLTASTNSPMGVVVDYISGTIGLIKTFTPDQAKVYAVGLAEPSG